MNVFVHEFKSFFKSTLIWALSLASLAVVFIIMFFALEKDIEIFKNIFSSLPEAVLKMLSVYIDKITSLEGFYSFAVVYLVLCGAIQAMSLGLGLVSKEVSGKTADFLMTKPMSRPAILTAKLSAGLCLLVFTNITYWIFTLAVSHAGNKEFDVKVFLMINATLFFIQLIFASIGVFIATVFGKINSVIAVSLSTVFGFFIVNMLGSVIGDDTVRYISPFKYFDLVYILENSSYDVTLVFVWAAVILIAIVSGYVFYIKKDVHAV